MAHFSAAAYKMPKGRRKPNPAFKAKVAYQVDSASKRIRLGLDQARASGKRVGRPSALNYEQFEQCRRMAVEGTGLRHIARVMGCSPTTVKRELGLGGE